MFKKIVLLMSTLPFIFMGKICAQETQQIPVAPYDFVPGDSILFVDDHHADTDGAVPSRWKITGGKALVQTLDNQRCIAIRQYYTKLVPKMSNAAYLPASWTLEFDYWLDAGYDGNPGVAIALMGKEEVVAIIPNKYELFAEMKSGRQSAQNPPELYSDNFYNKWIHIAISYQNKTLNVYENQYKVLTVPNIENKVTSLMVRGDESSEMKMLFKNFRLASGGGLSSIAASMAAGTYISHAINFEVGRSEVTASGMIVLREIANLLQAAPATRYEIGGYTDSDGDDAANMTLSQARAEEVRRQLVQLGVQQDRLTARGYGKTKPIADNKTAEGRAINRRVEFVKQ
ncbi:MAG: OmpA family protein [Candidatus Kapaibacterium sp.]